MSGGFRFGIYVVAAPVSEESLALTGFILLWKRKQRRNRRKIKMAKQTAERRNPVFGKRFPLSVSGFLSECEKKGKILPMMNQNQQDMPLPIDRKMLLSIREAAEYSNIGINKIDEMLKQPNCPFVLYVGTKKLVKRKAFEEFITSRVAI